MLTDMDEILKTRALLNDQLRDLVASEPLEALTAIGALQRVIAARQGEAVRAAAPLHTWAEIGEALGVSRQAAHQKFAKEWANTLKDELKSEIKTMKIAQREGDPAVATTAKARRDAVIDEFKAVHRRAKK